MTHAELIKGIAIGMMICGRSANQVEKELGINRSVVLRWWRRWQEEGNLKRRKGSGRPRVTRKRSDRSLVVQAKRQRFQSVPRLFVSWASAAGVTCSVRTAYRRLGEAGLKSYRPAVRIPLSVAHRHRRLTWCHEHAAWTQEAWRHVLWTDESRFTLDFHDGRLRVLRMPGERYAACCIAEHDRFGGGSVMIWAGIWYGGRTAAIVVNGNLNSERYKNEIIFPVVIPTVREMNLIFQDDNARPHRGAIVKSAISSAGIRTLPWPSRSPDLSPIEHAWDELRRRVRGAYTQSPSTLKDLAKRLKDQWELLDQTFFNSLCDSMFERIAACQTARGGHTRF